MKRVKQAALKAGILAMIVGLVGIERWKMGGQKSPRRMACLHWRVQMEIISTIIRNLNGRKSIISRNDIHQEIVTVRRMWVLQSRIRNKEGKAVTRIFRGDRARG